jgi:peptidoglycan/LPS O-acetylase OafA/YrhL
MRSAKREITDLTVCRAMFAAWVFTYHVDLHAHFAASLGAAAGLVRRGYLGVDGFFLLSGLILALVHPQLGQSPAGAMRFWVRRLARIYPVHLAVLLLLAAVAVIGFSLGVTPKDPGRFTLGSFVENVLLVQGWGVAGQLAWNYPSWSISTEWAGYLLFPALWYALWRLPDRLAAAMLGLCLAMLAIVDMRWRGLNLTFAYSLLRFVPEFAAGMATAKLLPRFARRVSARGLATAGLVLLLLSLLGGADVFVVGGLWAMLAAFAGQAVAGGGGVLPGLPLLRFLGVLSYAFYMSFGTVELFLAQLYRHQGWDPAASKLAYSVSMTLLTLILALSLHHLVENPARRRIDRWLAGRREPGEVVDAGLRRHDVV